MNRPDLDINTEAECSLVGAICIDSRTVERVRGKISSEDFTNESCAAVYEAAEDAVSRGRQWDNVLAVDLLIPSLGQAEAKRFIAECMQITPTCAKAELHARMIRKYADRRRMKQAIGDAADGSDDPQELAGALIDIGREYLQGKTTKRLKTLSDALADMYNGKSRSAQQNRIDTGFPRLDGILKGIWGGNLCIIGARPGVGKSAFALDIALTAAMAGKRSLIYSFEMLADELAERLIARTSAVELDQLIDSDLTDEEWTDVVKSGEYLRALPIVINDDTRTTVADIRSQARLFPDLKLIIVDYLTLVPTESQGKKYERRDLEVSAITRGLKNLASELRIPVIALSQLNREYDDTTEPTLRALRESGGIEQDASKVVFLWYTDREAGEIGVKVAKNRRGKSGVVKMRFDGSHMRYTELSEDYIPVRQSRKRRRYADVFDGEEGE